MIHNMQAVIARLATLSPGAGLGQYLFTPGPTFTNVDGIMVPSAPGPGFSATAAIQPVRGKTLEKLPEGARADDWKEVWVASLEEITCGDAFRPGGEGGRRGHTFEFRGVVYEFQSVTDWRDDGGFSHGMAQKVSR